MKKYISYILMTCLIIGFTFLVPGKVFSQANQKDTSTYVTGITAGRAKALVGAAVGLISLVIGWRSKVRSTTSKGNGRTGAFLALALGIIGIVLSVVHLSTSAGAVFGSGSGKAGAIVALVLSLIGITLGGLALRPKKI